MTFNNGVNYTVGGVSTGLIAAPNATLVKSGTGTVTLNTLTGGGASALNSGHSIGAVTLNAGVLNVGTVYAAGAQPSVNAITRFLVSVDPASRSIVVLLCEAISSTLPTVVSVQTR